MIDTGEPALMINDVAERLTAQRDNLVGQIQKSLSDLLYEHRAYLRPSQLKQIASAEADFFLDYLKSGDVEAITRYAAKRAEEGLGIRAVIRVLSTLEQFAQRYQTGDTWEGQTSCLVTYTTTYMERFIEAREAIILVEQERIRGAIQRSLTRYNLWLQAAADISRAATSTLNLRQLLSASVNLIRGHFNFQHVGLFLLDDSHEWVILRASSSDNEAKDAQRTVRVKIGGDSIVGKCGASGEAKILTDIRAEEYQNDPALLPQTRSAMVLPLITRGQVIGAIFIQSAHATTFNDDDVTRLQTIADQIANAIQNAYLYHELQAHSQSLAEAVQARTVELQRTKERVEAILNNSPDAILLLGADGTIELCNTAFYELFGYETAETTGKPLNSLIEPSYTDMLNDLLQTAIDKGQATRFQILAQRKNTSTFNAGAGLASIQKGGVITGLVCSLRDISEQVQAEERVKASLREKEVLLREIHHRVKNNMQVISSLLALQAGYTDNEHTTQMFRESQNRIRSMALVHERLYQSQELARIDFAEYVHELTGHLLNSYRTQANLITLDVLADVIYLDIDMAIPCGLIINELVSNALKHAFPNGRSGKITVELRIDSNGLHTILVRDDGVGIPDELNVHRTESLGLQLVTSLTGQLNATIGLHRGQGTTFEIRFAIPSTKRSLSRVERAVRSTRPLAE
ncbi:MAG: PAS domain S-box protein [Anaerolineae bacterium]|nr:PAS domain S-box protein [Anaerolineae bacterium]